MFFLLDVLVIIGNVYMEKRQGDIRTFCLRINKQNGKK